MGTKQNLSTPLQNAGLNKTDAKKALGRNNQCYL